MARFAFVQDALVPVMLHPSNPADTLYIVLEEDWRLYSKHGDSASDETRLRQVMEEPSSSSGGGGGTRATESLTPSQTPTAQAGTSESLTPTAPASSSTTWRPGARKLGSEPGGSLEHRLTMRMEKPSGSKVRDFPQTLMDIVRYANQAARVDLGDLVWMAWEANRKKRGTPSHGLTMLCLSKAGAMELDVWLKNQKVVYRYDLMLLNALKEPNRDLLRRASFVWPAIGSYAKHLSGCQLEAGGEFYRDSSWESTWIGEGTRGCRQSPASRWICRFGVAEHEKWALEVKCDTLDDESLSWKSYALELLPAGSAEDDEGEELDASRPKRRSGRARRSHRRDLELFYKRVFVDDQSQAIRSGKCSSLGRFCNLANCSAGVIRCCSSCVSMGLYVFADFVFQCVCLLCSPARLTVSFRTRGLCSETPPPSPP